MNIEDMLAKDGIIPRLKAEDKKQALQALAAKAEAATGANAHDIFAALLQREQPGHRHLPRRTRHKYSDDSKQMKSVLLTEVVRDRSRWERCWRARPRSATVVVRRVDGGVIGA